jgi:hypothetical protein
MSFIIRSINLFLQRKIQSYGESFSWTYTVLFNDNTIGNPIKNTSVFQDDEFLFITAGGFDGEDKDKAFLVSGGCTRDYDLACGNHEEADTRV